MKRVILIIFCLLFVVCSLSVQRVHAFAEHLKTRQINLVYDDSGSMIVMDGKYFDTWCQAKYAMEVFAALLDQNDTLNVYVMSDFGSSSSAPPRLVLRGSESSQSRVAKVHNLMTRAGGTPFASVEKAYADLVKSQADEKWLVVLTDGEFNNMPGMQVESRMNQYVNNGDVRVMFLSIGSDAPTLLGNPAKGFFFEKAATSGEILARLTAISNRLFERNALVFSNSSTRQFSVDVPLQELMVFAQGQNAQVQLLRGSNAEYRPTDVVGVKYSEKAALNYENDKNVIINRNLTGVVVTFRDIPAGSYRLEVSGVTTVEMYYKPDVQIGARLYKGLEEVSAKGKLVAGEYVLKFGFVNAKGEFFESSLLGKVTSRAIVHNAGNKLECQSGDKISVERGDLFIDITAQYLEYNTLTASMAFKVLAAAAPLELVVEPPQQVYVVSNLAGAAQGIVVTVNQKGMPITDEQWMLMNLPTVKSKSKVDFEVVRGTEPATFVIYPQEKKGNKYATSTGNIAITVSGELVFDEQISKGSMSARFTIENDIPLWDRLVNWFRIYGLRLQIGLAVLALVLGYVPPFKKYLPRRLKKRPTIYGMPKGIGGHEGTFTGALEKDLASTLIPYKAETGTLRYVPKGVSGFPSLKLKAAGSNGMYVTNATSLAGNIRLEFDGATVPEDIKRPFRKSAGIMITASTETMVYECRPNA